MWYACMHLHTFCGVDVRVKRSVHCCHVLSVLASHTLVLGRKRHASRMRKRVVKTVLAAKIRAQLLSMLAIRHKLCADRLAFVICGCADACGRVPRARSLQ